MVTVCMSVSITKVYTALSTAHAYHTTKEARDSDGNRKSTVIPVTGPTYFLPAAWSTPFHCLHNM